MFLRARRFLFVKKKRIGEFVLNFAQTNETKRAKQRLTMVCPLRVKQWFYVRRKRFRDGREAVEDDGTSTTDEKRGVSE